MRFCENCQEEIPSRRLESVPDAEHCVSCQLLKDAAIAEGLNQPKDPLIELMKYLNKFYRKPPSDDDEPPPSACPAFLGPGPPPPLPLLRLKLPEG